MTIKRVISRRSFLKLSLGALSLMSLANVAAAAGRNSTVQAVKRKAVRLARPIGAPLDVTLPVNGQELHLRIDPRLSLLDALREEAGLTGTKKGCDHGQCGACTVLIDGRRVLSCLTLAAMAAGRQITTIEGLAQGESLHVVQAAFLKNDAFQCGYCTSGQIMAAVGLLAEGCPADPAAIRECMSGNLCRCGAYPNIVAAVQEARSTMAV